MKSRLLLSAKYRLLLGASFFSVSLAVTGTVTAQPPNPNNSPWPADNISGTINGSFVNNSRIGTHSDQTGLYVDSSAIITGDLKNSVGAQILGSETGLYIDNADIRGSVVNSGLISAEGTDGGWGIYMWGDAGANPARVVNSGRIVSNASTQQLAGELVYITEHAGGIYQSLSGSQSFVESVVSNGTVDVNATAIGSATSDYAWASAHGNGIQQYLDSYNGSGSVTADNSDGRIDVQVVATARGANNDDTAYASADAYGAGIAQSVIANGSELARDAVAHAINDNGSISVDVSAQATGGDGGSDSAYASADADAYGVKQYAYSAYGNATATLSNNHDGLIDVAATARADGGNNVGTEHCQ